MKRVYPFLILYFFMTSYVSDSYQIKSCKIEFVFANGLQTGQKTLIFDKYGSLEKEEGKSIVNKISNDEIPRELINQRVSYHLLTIKTNNSIFNIDLDSMTGTKKVLLEANRDVIDFRANKVGESFYLNRKCDIVNYNGVKIWYWKGIALKKEFPSSGGAIYEYATAIDENYLVKKDEFSIPKNIKFNSSQ